MDKRQALAKFLEIEETEIDEENEDTFTIGRNEYLVLTDDEADQKAKEYILSSVWAFNASFLLGHMPNGMSEEMLKIVHEKKSEDCNDQFLELIEDKKHFVEDAISADGRGHFISQYDGEENEQDEFFIYRIN